MRTIKKYVIPCEGGIIEFRDEKALRILEATMTDVLTLWIEVDTEENEAKNIYFISAKTNDAVPADKIWNHFRSFIFGPWEYHLYFSVLEVDVKEVPDQEEVE